MLSRSLVLIFGFTGSAAMAQPKPEPPPVSADPRLVVELFAAAPDIVHPIATDFDAKGRLLVVESHTHFRPAKYDGPKHDRILRIEDTDGDGKADRFVPYYEGLVHTMDLAVHVDGSVYVATRNEVLRLRDTDGDGKADERVRLAFLETAGNYPHNGLCGLSFDSRGDLTFGIGENLGAPYKLIGADGTTLSGGGEGGNVYHCTADGKQLRRVATGFWNPFGSCRDIFGRLFVVDNDPDSSPPCRLLHVVPGGDYGYQFRYGRSGRHPFQAWNGELPGTLPMVAGTGESPCEVVSYESDGLPDEYRGELLVPVWADHRIERYTLTPNGASVKGARKAFIQGGREFRPSGLTVAPDGSLFITDWVSRSYELHGKGAIWHVRWKDTKPRTRPTDPKVAIEHPDRHTREGAARQLAKTDAGRVVLRNLLGSENVRVRAAALIALIDVKDGKINLDAIASKDASPELRALAVRALIARGDTAAITTGIAEQPAVQAEAIRGERARPEAVPTIRRMLGDEDPFIRHAAVQRLAESATLRMQFDHTGSKDPKERAQLLLAWRAASGGDAAELRVLADFLRDTDPDVRFLAIKWVADEKLTTFRSRIVELMKDPALDPRSVVALATALARLDDKPVNEDGLATHFLERLRDTSTPGASRASALRAVPATHAKLQVAFLLDLLSQDDTTLRIEVLRTLADRGDVKAATAVLAIARDPNQPISIRAQALVTLAALGQADVPLLTGLASGKDPVLAQEALRTLTTATLTAEQRAVLQASTKSKPELADLASRVMGKAFAPARPAATDTEAWLKRLEGPADVEAGRRVFENPRVSGCSSCHRLDGRGANVGPDLSLIGRTDRRWIVESILQPSAVVAPHYQAYRVETSDGRTVTGLLVGTYLDESVYVDEKGNRVKLLAGDVTSTNLVRNSIMPERLVDRLTDQELRDLIAYLAARK